jgi:hypothetical protein
MKALRMLLAALLGGVAGCALVGAVAWLTCGTIGYLIDPNPEMVHPFFFPASLGGIAGALAGFVFGAIVGAGKAK